MTAFNKNHPDLLKVYTEVILTRKVDYFFLDDVIDELIETHEKLPSVYSIIQMVSKKKFIDGQKDDSKFQAELKREAERFEVVKADCLKVISQTDIDNYVSFWLKYVFSADLEANLSSWGVGKKLFEKSALFDLHRAKFDPKRAVAIGKEKMAKLDQDKKNKTYSLPN